MDKNLSSVLPDLDKYPRWEKQIIIVINNCEGILSWQKYYVVNFFSCGEQRKEYIQWCLWEGDIHITGVWVGNPKHKKDLCVLQHFVIATHLVIRVAGWSTQFRRQLRPVANCNYFIKPIRNAEIFWTTKSSEESSLSSIISLSSLWRLLKYFIQCELLIARWTFLELFKNQEPAYPKMILNVQTNCGYVVYFHCRSWKSLLGGASL